MNLFAGTRGWVGLGIPAYLLALVCSAELSAQQQGETRITAVRNQVRQNSGGTNAPADVGQALKPGEVVETGEQGLVEIKSTDATTVRMGEGSRAVYDPRDRIVKLDRGTVVVDAPSDGEPVKIDLGGVTYTVTTEETDRSKLKDTHHADPEKSAPQSKNNSQFLKDQKTTNSK